MSTQQIWVKGVTNELNALRYAYPVNQDETAWKARLNTYIDDLKPFDLDIIIRACKLARSPAYYPDWFPNAGQLVRVCQDIVRERGAEKKQTALNEFKSPRVDAHYYDDVPMSPEEQERWISEGANAFKRLARKWKADSCNRRLDPNHPTPPEIHEARLKEFWQTWESNGLDAQPITHHAETEAGVRG